MIAQLVSQVSSHGIIHYHRKVIREAEQTHLFTTSTAPIEVGEEGSAFDERLGNGESYFVESEKVERLCDHAFTRPHRGENERLVPRSYVNTVLVGAFALLSAMIIAGCSVPSYSLEVLGIVGILVESGQQFAEAASYYNVFDTVSLLFNQASFTEKVGDYVGLGSLSILLVVTVLLVPLAQSAVLLYTWFQPITRKRRYRVMIVIETLSAWQYTEVFFFAVIVASW